MTLHVVFDDPVDRTAQLFLLRPVEVRTKKIEKELHAEFRSVELLLVFDHRGHVLQMRDAHVALRFAPQTEVQENVLNQLVGQEVRGLDESTAVDQLLNGDQQLLVDEERRETSEMLSEQFDVVLFRHLFRESHHRAGGENATEEVQHGSDGIGNQTIVDLREMHLRLFTDDDPVRSTFSLRGRRERIGGGRRLSVVTLLEQVNQRIENRTTAQIEQRLREGTQPETRAVVQTTVHLRGTSGDVDAHLSIARQGMIEEERTSGEIVEENERRRGFVVADRMLLMAEISAHGVQMFHLTFVQGLSDDPHAGQLTVQTRGLAEERLLTVRLDSDQGLRVQRLMFLTGDRGLRSRGEQAFEGLDGFRQGRGEVHRVTLRAGGQGAGPLARGPDRGQTDRFTGQGNVFEVFHLFPPLTVDVHRQLTAGDRVECRDEQRRTLSRMNDGQRMPPTVDQIIAFAQFHVNEVASIADRDVDRGIADEGFETRGIGVEGVDLATSIVRVTVRLVVQSQPAMEGEVQRERWPATNDRKNDAAVRTLQIEVGGDALGVGVIVFGSSDQHAEELFPEGRRSQKELTDRANVVAGDREASEFLQDGEDRVENDAIVEGLGRGREDLDQGSGDPVGTGHHFVLHRARDDDLNGMKNLLLVRDVG